MIDKDQVESVASILWKRHLAREVREKTGYIVSSRDIRPGAGFGDYRVELFRGALVLRRIQ